MLCEHVSVRACLSVLVYRQRRTLSALFPSPIYSLEPGSLMELTELLAWWPACPSEPPVCLPLRAGVTGHQVIPSVFYVCWDLNSDCHACPTRTLTQGGISLQPIPLPFKDVFLSFIQGPLPGIYQPSIGRDAPAPKSY